MLHWNHWSFFECFTTVTFIAMMVTMLPQKAAGGSLVSEQNLKHKWFEQWSSALFFNLIYNRHPLSFFLLTNARVNRGYVEPTWISLSLHSTVICCMNRLLHSYIIYSSHTHCSMHTVQWGWIIYISWYVCHGSLYHY